MGSPTAARTHEIRTPTGRHVRDMMMIFNDIDPEGQYKVILDQQARLPRLPRPAAIVANPTPEDVLAVNLLILQGDQIFHHRRSRHQRYQEEPPSHCLEDEAESEDSDEEHADRGSCTSGPPGKVTEGKVPVLGVLDKTSGVEVAFGSVLEFHVSGPAK